MRFLRAHYERTTLILISCIAFLVGIGLSKTGLQANGLSCLALGVLLLIACARHSLWALIVYMLFGFCLGVWRGGVYVDKLAMYDDLYDQKLSLVVTASTDASYNKYKQLAFDARDVTLPDGTVLKGKLSVSGYGLNAVFQGDRILVTGKLKPSLGSYQGRLSFSVLELIEHQPSLLNDFRRNFTAAIQSSLPEPGNNFAMGILVGQRTNLPEDVKQDLLAVGLTHIIAVSGYNLTIMLRASKKLFDKRSKRVATALSLLLIFVFLALTGASASIVRAAIVSVLSIAASYYGRDFKPLLLIFMAATITAYANPAYVWSDSGWYLSFFAFFGVMILAPLITEHWPEKLQNSIIAMVAMESLCAEVFTLPYLLHVFEQMSSVGLLGNVLIAVFVPIAMLLCFVAGIAGMVAAPIAGWFAWPASFVLLYMLDMARTLARLPHAFVENISLSTPAMVAMYGIAISLTMALHFKRHPKTGIITDID